MSTMISEVYEAFKLAGVSEEKAAAAARSIIDVNKEDGVRVEKETLEIKKDTANIKDRLSTVESDLQLIKWMMGVLITMNIGILLLLIKTVSR